MMNDDESMQGVQLKAAQVEMLNQQVQSLQFRLVEMERTLEEMSVLKVGLKNMETVRAGDDMLIPLGASVYAQGTASENRKVIVNIGAGIFVEKHIKDALPMVDKQLKTLAEHEQLIVDNINAFSREAERLTAELNAEIMAMQNARFPS